MKVTVFNGSPKGENSNTNVLAEAFLQGARDAGAETENIFLIDKEIHHCRGCFACWFKTPGQCIQRDDMDAFLPRYKASDIVCFATPVYLWNMTACLKNFLDRLIPTRNPNLVETHGDFDMESNLAQAPKVVIISNSGFPGDSNFDTMREVMKSADPILEIYRNNGMLLRTKRDDLRPLVQAYLAFVRAAGFEVTSGTGLRDATRDGLLAPLLTTEEYIRAIGG